MGRAAASVLVVVLRYAHERYRASSLYATHAHGFDPDHVPPPQIIVPESFANDSVAANETTPTPRGDA